MKELQRIGLRRAALVDRIKAIRYLKRKALKKATGKREIAPRPNIPNSKKIHLTLEEAIAKKTRLEE